MIKKDIKFFIFLALFLQSNPSFCTQAIIWDLGGVLFNPDKLTMAYNEIGLKDILWYSIRDFQNPKKIQRRVFETLYTLDEGSSENASYDNGLRLPDIMCRWLEGKQNPKIMIDIIYKKMDELEKQKFFVSSREKNVLKKVITTIFDPTILAKYMLPATKSYSLLKEIMQHPDCEQYILSNWDPYSFAELYQSKHGLTIFNFFKPEHIFTSGTCGIIKPNTQIFDYILAKHNLNPAECIFIDDQIENIKAANACGIQTIWFNNVNFEELRMQLYKHGFLKPVAKAQNPATTS